MPHLRRLLYTCLVAGAVAALPAVTFAQGAGQDTTGTRVRDSVPQHRRVTTDTSNGSMSGTPRNQSQSGVTNGKTGKSTLGPNIKKTSPTSGAAVTAKGDTLRAPDSTRAMHRRGMKKSTRDSMGMRDSTPQ